jgi:hypothetical protein
MRGTGGMILARKTELFFKKTCPTNLTGTDLGSKPGLAVRGRRHISLAMAQPSMKVTLNSVLCSYVRHCIQACGFLNAPNLVQDSTSDLVIE